MEHCGGFNWLLAVLWFRLRSNQPHVLGVNWRAGKPLAHVQRSEGILKNRLKDGLETPKCNTTKVQNKMSELKLRHLSCLHYWLAVTIHSINTAVRMGPVWALPELQLHCRPGDSPLEQGPLSRLETPYLRLRDPSLPKAERSPTCGGSVVSDW